MPTRAYDDIPDSGAPARKTELFWLIAAGLASIVLWQLPLGNYLLYPFTILATWFHEMGHGLSAMLLGGEFRHLVLYTNGSGTATHGGPLFFGPLGQALVSAGGPMGPAFAGAFFILAGRRYRLAHYSLYFLGGLLVLSALVWVRSLFGFAMISGLGVAVLLVALKTAHWFQGFTIQFLGVQACLSTWQQVGYLFTHSAEIGGQHMLSDTARIAEYLFLPYWFWGGVIIALTLGLLGLSLWLAYR